MKLHTEIMLGALLAASVVACGGPARDPNVAGRTATGESAANADTIKNNVMVTLAKTDRRLAHRLEMKPEGIALLFPENRAPAELEALFEYKTREQRLVEARASIDAAKARGERDYDWRGIDRLVVEEQARLATERDMPLGASAMIRSLTFDIPTAGMSAEDTSFEDRGLASTLDRLKDTLKEHKLGAMQLAELDDQLDAFEKRTAGFTSAPGAIARLRVALSEVKPRPSEDVPDWKTTEQSITAFVGVLPPDLDAKLEQAHRTLRSRVDPLLPKGSADRARVASDAVIALLAPSACPNKTGAAREPVERFGMCTLLSAAAKGEDVRSLVMLDLALDFARWSLAVHRTRTKPSDTFAALRTQIPLDESDGAHAFRFALVHPVEAITMGWTAAIIAGAPTTKAQRWLAAGAKTPGEMAAHLM